MKSSVVLLIFIMSVFSEDVFATGYEKPILWSGKYGAMGGASVSSVAGPEALAFNPAGLADTQGREAELAVSPDFLRKKGPIYPAADSVTMTKGGEELWGKSGVTYPFALLGATKVTDRLGVGFGFFSTAGGGGAFGDLNYGDAFTALHPESSATLSFGDLSIGAGYRVLPGLRVGVAWRTAVAIGDGKFAMPQLNESGSVVAVSAFHLADMSDKNFTGFRLGAQYTPESGTWGVGANFRSGVKHTLTGTSSGQRQVLGSSDVTNLTGGNITVETELPWQLALGGHADFGLWRVLSEYDFTKYTNTKTITYSGDSIGGFPPSALTQQLGWVNLHTIRLGTEYSISPSSALRAGYTISSQVTPSDRANYGCVPPGLSHTVTIGGGTHFLKNDALSTDVGLDLSESKGTASNTTVPGNLDGTYLLLAATLHTSVSYRF